MQLHDGFRIGDWDVLPREGRIVRGDESVRVRPKAMDVLCVLAASAGRVVERDSILSAVWGRTAVTDEPLTATVGELRRLLREREASARYIETVPKRGYRLLLEVHPLPPEPETAAPRAAPLATPFTTVREDVTARDARLPLLRWDIRMVPALLLVAVAVTVGWWAVSQAQNDAVAIAVLPFQDLSRDASQGYFADGLAEELMSLLTRVPRLRVAARDSAFAFRQHDQDIRDVAAQLNVAHVLTGSVRRSGDRIRVTAQLVDGRAGYQIWSDSYEKTLSDVFAIQDDIASRVVERLRIELLGAAPAVRATDPHAYTLHLQARYVGRQHTAEGFEQAVMLYRQALEIDADYLPAWTELAGVYLNMEGVGMLGPGEGMRLAREAAHRALAVDADYAPAHDRLGWIALHADNDLAGAAAHYRRALHLAPRDDVVRSNAAVLAVALGRMEDALTLLEGSVEYDPVSPIAHANLANAYLLAGRVDAAEVSIRRALTLSPQYAAGHYRLGRVLLAKGDLEEALAAMQAEPLEAARLIGLALVHQALGDSERSSSALAEVKELWGDRAAGNYAQVYAYRGEHDLAFQWLERTLEANGSGEFLEFQWDPVFASLHDDPRWPAILERAGYGVEQRARVAFSLPPAVAEPAEPEPVAAVY